MVQTVAIADPSSNGEVAVQFLSELKAFNALQFLGLIGSVLSLVTALFSSVPRQATCAASCCLALVIQGSTLTLTETLIIPNSKMSFATNVKFSSVSYCSLENHLPGRITAALVIILIVPMLVLNLLIYLSFRKHRSFLQEGNYTSMFVRVSAFTLCGLISVIVGLFFFLRAFIGGGDSNQGLVELDIILAMGKIIELSRLAQALTIYTAPVSAVVIFGTHKDLLNVWLFWRNQTPIAKKVENPVLPLSNVHIEYEVVIE
ncbi:hypothetical protein F5890DRAFT_1478633 [Lentinula detonsa]|uniref:Uncharacterized protein n=1 Tax=Lentinula detonsa TaxID=2804962 RepID=A0AA38PQD1_9AGAR|nr:hypothetical protein F5890DRAFT_1478633 [Lentinula detonsa]